MHPSIGLDNLPGEVKSEVPILKLRVSEPAEKRRAVAHFRRVIVACEAAADLLTITVAVNLGYVLYDNLALGKRVHYPAHAVLGMAFGFAIVMVLMLARAGAYGRGGSLLRVKETEQVLRVSLQVFLIVVAVSFFSTFLFSRWLLVLCLTLVPFALFV